jgi:uncharacterized protein (DUF1501 family)
MKRRTFLKSIAATAATAPIMLNGIPVRAQTSLPFLAQMPQSAQGKVLVFIQLFGGNDGLNTVIPVNDPNYYTLRPMLSQAGQSAIMVEPNLIYFNYGLCQGPLQGFQGMLQKGWLEIVQGVGYPSPNLSHFRSTDIWLSGINPNGNSSVMLDSGWVGRMLEKQWPDFPAKLPDYPLAIQLGGFSLTLIGNQGVPTGIQVGDPSKQASVSSIDETLDDASNGTNYATEYAFIDQVAVNSNKYATNIKNAYAAGKTQLKAAYGSDSFGQQMASVAALIAGGLGTSVYVVSLGGFDTHVTQQTDGTHGTQINLLSYLADGVAEFMHDMVALGLADRVVGMTVSEFGRRPEENGSFGTDHGAANVQFVWGTQVNSGMIGKVPDLSPTGGMLDENQDLIYQYDYRSIYLDIMMKWFGMTLNDALTVLELQGSNAVLPLDVIQPQAGVSQKYELPNAGVKIANYPNPFTSSTTFELVLPNAMDVTMDISNVAGQSVSRVVDRRLDAGMHQIPFSANLPSGVYLCSIVAGGTRLSHFIQCNR